MKIPSAKVLAINAVLIAVMLGGVAAAGRSFLGPPPAEVCSKRYNLSTALAYEQGGNIWTAVDLQARASGRDVGIMQNVSFRRTNQGPSPVVMAVNIPPIDADAPRGISYPWAPKILPGKTAGCLSYNVFLSQDFNFGPGGSLPGFAGELPGETTAAFRVWPMWTATGHTNVLSYARHGKDEATMPYRDDAVELPRGRWVNIEQEVVLNAPRSANGLIRLWVDGRLLIEQKDVVMRNDAKVVLTGVSADVHYGRSLEGVVRNAPKAVTVWLSPLEVRAQP
jgi:hypothetical protein